MKFLQPPSLTVCYINASSYSSQAEATGWPTGKPYSNSPRLKTRMKKAGYSPAILLLLNKSIPL